jgi:hypothetical protein
MSFLQRDISFDDYVAIFRQRKWRKTHPSSAGSVLEILLRADDRASGEWPVPLDLVEAVGDTLSADERRNPERLTQYRRADLASSIGVHEADIDKLFQHFDIIRDVARAYQQRGLWSRFAVLAKNDPALRWLKRRTGHGFDQPQGGD